ncbi:MAG TPA: hypothetical protein VEY50_07980 [Lysobacter sp.]|nr:hypothetical protein [Lysobacter sp.]
MPMRRLGWTLLAAAASLPLGMLLAFLLMPVWVWIERTSGIEAAGHSGPATWCFLLSWAGWFALLLAALRRRLRG